MALLLSIEEMNLMVLVLASGIGQIKMFVLKYSLILLRSISGVMVVILMMVMMIRMTMMMLMSRVEEFNRWIWLS